MKQAIERVMSSVVLLLTYLLILTTPLEAGTMNVGSDSGMRGETDIIIPVDLSASTGEEVCGFNLDLTFDNTRLSFKNVALGPKAQEAGKSLSSSTPGDDVVTAVVIGFNQNVIEDGTVLNFTFDILPNAPGGNAALTITNSSLSDCQGSLLPVSIQNGGVFVEGGSSTTSTRKSTTTTTITNISTTISTTSSQLTTTSTTTTTSISHVWPLLYDRMWSEERERNLFLLRSFRDELLVATEAGREYIFMIYANSLEIALLLFLNPDLTEHAAMVAQGFLKGIDSLLYHDEMVIDHAAIEQLYVLLNRLELLASPQLQYLIGRIRADVTEEGKTSQLGLSIVE